MEIFGIASTLQEKPKAVEIVLGKAENYFIINVLRISRLFQLAVVGGPSFACRLMVSGVCARDQVSEWISFPI